MYLGDGLLAQAVSSMAWMITSISIPSSISSVRYQPICDGISPKTLWYAATMRSLSSKTPGSVSILVPVLLLFRFGDSVILVVAAVMGMILFCAAFVIVMTLSAVMLVER